MPAGGARWAAPAAGRKAAPTHAHRTSFAQISFAQRLLIGICVGPRSWRRLYWRAADRGHGATPRRLQAGSRALRLGERCGLPATVVPRRRRRCRRCVAAGHRGTRCPALQVADLGEGVEGAVKLMRERASGRLVAVKYVRRGASVSAPSSCGPVATSALPAVGCLMLLAATPVSLAEISRQWEAVFRPLQRGWLRASFGAPCLACPRPPARLCRAPGSSQRAAAGLAVPWLKVACSCSPLPQIDESVENEILNHMRLSGHPHIVQFYEASGGRVVGAAGCCVASDSVCRPGRAHAMPTRLGRALWMLAVPAAPHSAPSSRRQSSCCARPPCRPSSRPPTWASQWRQLLAAVSLTWSQTASGCMNGRPASCSSSWSPLWPGATAR